MITFQWLFHDLYMKFYLHEDYSNVDKLLISLIKTYLGLDVEKIIKRPGYCDINYLIPNGIKPKI